MPGKPTRSQLNDIAADIRRHGLALGFQQIGFSDLDLSQAGERLQAWLAKGFHGEMTYMTRHGTKRSRPAALVPGTASVITARMDYLPDEQEPPAGLLDHGSKAYVSRYALGRDYHKVLRRRLAKLAQMIEQQIGPLGHRAFVDSGPVMEKPLAEKSGLGWIGKHTNLINRDAGSWFFLGEIYVDIELPPDAAESSHCGTCHACIDVCPTGAIVSPYELDARRCISYLTIELDGPIPIEFREQIGNRIFGCDDCQLFCPWNKFAVPTAEGDFAPRHGLDDAELTELFAWGEPTWLAVTEGSAIRRIGYERWQRNIAVALGNAATTEAVIDALTAKLGTDSEMIRDHVQWALERHGSVPHGPDKPETG
ncbi:MAG: tRNA epoxyqueuosine(34) reductase QueG [Gammaproteobacteria bacterium]|nr:tRNA epoxyqueuosine(34) reductase QueG [Gammaproteobacteria bacterium]